MRLQNIDDPATHAYSQWLLEVGEGRIPSQSYGIPLSPSVKVVSDTEAAPGAAIWESHVFCNISELDTSDTPANETLDDCAQYFAQRVILAPSTTTPSAST